MELWMARLWFFPFSNDGREKRMFEVVRKRIYKMYLCILRDFSLEKISCKNTTTFSLKVFYKTNTKVSSIFSDEDIQLLIIDTMFWKRYLNCSCYC